MGHRRRESLNFLRHSNDPSETPPLTEVRNSNEIPMEEGLQEESPKGKERIWYTKQTADPSKRNLYLKSVLKELVIFITFLTILCILAFGMASQTKYYFTQSMSSLLLDTPFDERDGSFRSATQIADFWKFAETAMIDSLYWDDWFGAGESSTIDSEESSMILYENKILGLPRLRQLRARDDSCEIHEDFKRTFSKCYDFFSLSAQDKSPFGPGDDTAWRYHTPSELDGSMHWGYLTNYPGGGYYMDLSKDKNSTINALQSLKENAWISRGTRAVFLDFTVYNANVNLFCVVKLIMEFPPTGGVIPSWSFNTVKLLRYVTSFDYFVLACEIMFVMFIMFYTMEEIYEVTIMKWSYLKCMWSYLDLIILTVSWMAIAFNAYRYYVVKSLLPKMIKEQEKYSNFEFLGFWQSQFNNGVGLLLFFSWLKVFKYMSFNQTMTELSRTLSRCAKDVAGFAVMFFIVFFAFVQLAYLLFGSQVKDFSSIGNSVFTLLQIILGEFDFDALEKANRVLGPIFFFCYVFFVFFILLNMFLAIINDTYSEIKTEISIYKQDFEVMKYMHHVYDKLRRKLKKQASIPEQTDKLMSYKELKEKLKRSNFSDLEVEMFFAKYGLSGDGYLTESDLAKMTDDLIAKPVTVKTSSSSDESSSSSSAPEISNEAFNMLQDRVSQIEQTLEAVAAKIDRVTLILAELDVGG